jgi:small-conductance mechanosensitive channel
MPRRPAHLPVCHDAAMRLDTPLVRHGTARAVSRMESSALSDFTIPLHRAPGRRLLATGLALVLTLVLMLPALGQGLTPAPAAPADPAAAEAPPPAAALAQILRDPAARDALIAELDKIAGTGAAVDAGTDAAEAAVPVNPLDIDPLSLGRDLAAVTQAAAEDAAERAKELWLALENAPAAFDGLTGDEIGVVLTALQTLLPVIAVTVGTFLVLRTLAKPVYRRFGRKAQKRGGLQRTWLFLAAGLIDVTISVLAWAIGYAVATTVLGEFGRIGLLQTLYLNAFLAVGLIKTLVRLILSPATAGLRPVPITDRAAKYLTRRASLLINMLGYGKMLLLPVVNINVSFQAGQAVSTLVSVLAILLVTGMVIAKRRPVADWLVAQMRPLRAAEDPSDPSEPAGDGEDADTAEDAPPAGLMIGLARGWHWWALAYLASVLVLVLARPGPFVFDVMVASGQIIGALVVGLLVSGALSRVISTGVQLPQGLNARLPMLEQRLNMIAPQLLWLLRALILVALIVFTVATLGVLPLGDVLNSDLGLRLTGSVIGLTFILMMGGAVWLAMNAWIDHRLNPGAGALANPREHTLLSLLRNAGTIAILVFTAMFALSEIGLNIGPLLASAGVVGLAIGFGAQTMVRDIITGVFLQFERAINVGDVITAAGITGGVEKMTVRSVSLRDVNGVYHVIPFSSVDSVSNFTRGFAFYVIDMGVAYREDVGEVKQAMFDAYDELARDPVQRHNLTEDSLEWFGLDSFGDNAVVLKSRIRTLPGKQWGVGRAYNEIVKRIFDERGIEIPFPHTTLFLGERKDGTTQTVRFAPDPGASLAAPTAPAP